MYQMKKVFKRLRSLLCIAVVAALIGGSAGVVNGDSIEGKKEESLLEATPSIGYEQVASTNELRLFAEKTSGRFYVQDCASNSIWYSNPLDWEEDTKASGVYRMELCSLVVVHGIDVVNKQKFKKNSETSCVRKNKLTYEKTANGFQVTYRFEDEGFVIPVSVWLQDDSLKVAVELDGVREEKPDTALLESIDLLPYFGAAGKEAEGYVFVPDGCGALMYLNNDKQTYAPYEQPIFGQDQAMQVATKQTNKQDINLPVYGIKSGETAFLTIVSQNEEMGTICAVPNMKTSEYAQAFCRFEFRRATQFVLGEDSSSPQTTLMYRKGDMGLSGRFEVTMCFLTGDNANYSGMARRYRDYLNLKTKANDGKSSLYVDFYGAVRGTGFFLGIPYKKTELLTTFRDAKNLTSEIYETLNVPMTVRYLSWNRDGLNGKVDTHVKPVSGLGNVKMIKELEQYLTSVNGNLYLNFDNLMYQKSGNGVSQFFDSCKSLTKVPAYQYQYYFSTRLKNKDKATSYLLTSDKLAKVSDALRLNLQKQGVSHISFTNLGRILYSDYSGNYVSRAQMREAMVDQLAKYAENNAVLLSDPKAYALPYANCVIDIPLNSSDFDVMDESVPFLQMVLSGSLSYAGPALNLSENPRQTFLQSMESGCALHYSFIAEDSEKLIDTDLDGLYSADVASWREDMATNQQALEELKRLTDGSRIQSHEKLTEKVYVSRYENGVAVYINYGDSEETVSGVRIEGQGYLITKG